MNHGVVLRSAGYRQSAPRGCPLAGVEAARALGVELDGHRSAELDAAMIREADAIFVFDDESRRRVAQAYPEAREKTFPLGWLTTAGPIEIRDPYGGAADDFVRTYDAIRRALDAAVSEAELGATASNAA
jgi:protein-tyrosine-phosphatase